MNHDSGLDEFDKLYPLTPNDWILHAVPNLIFVQSAIRKENPPGFLLSHLHQAVKISLKAVLKSCKLKLDSSDNLMSLVKELKSYGKIDLPDFLDDLKILDSVSVTYSYQQDSAETSEEEIETALRLADAIYQWAREYVEQNS